MINLIKENNFITGLTKQFERSPFQLNKLHQSDSEIISLPNKSDYKIALTTDTIAEEIELGIYDDPYLIGWMIVMANMSDLAAVGAEPIGIVISESFPKNFPSKALNKLQKGISDACKTCNTFVLGGDTNFSESLTISGASLGIIKEKPLLRVGCKAGDFLYSSGKIGSGNAFALTKLIDENRPKYKYKPIAKIKEGQIVSKFATACMDTSDGLFSTLDQLMRLNGLGFELSGNWESALDDEAKLLFNQYKFPTWFLLAGQHGGFEIIFTVSKQKDQAFKKDAKSKKWTPQFLGAVISEPKIKMSLYNKTISINTERIRNFSLRKKPDIKNYIKTLINMDEDFQKSA